MKHLFFALTLVMCFWVSSANVNRSASKTTEVENREVKGKRTTITRFKGEQINKLDLSNSFNVYIKQGNQTGIVVEIDTEREEYLVCELENGKLKLGFNNMQQMNSGVNFRSSKATITINSLDELSITGSTDLYFNSKITGNNTQIRKTGSNDIYGLDLNVNGDMSIHSTGSGDIKDLLLSGANKLYIRSSGSGDMYIRGKVNTLDVGITGSGDGHFDKLEAQSATVSGSGSTDITCWAVQSLSINKSGSGSVRYKGNPSITTSHGKNISKL